MASTVEKVKHALHLDKNHSTGTTHTHNTTGNTTTGHSGTAEGVAGAHTGSHTTGVHNGTSGVGHTGHTTGVTGGTGTTTSTGYNTSTNAGPHDSNIANKLDPRVDSDLDGSRNLGARGTGTTGTGAYDGMHAGNSTGNRHTGTTGGISNSTNAGPHNSNLANKADPRVDSDLDGRGNRHGAATGGGILGASGSHATAGSGTAQNTAGPHNSDLANKLDPRVDADLDGSKTIGGNKTHA